MDKDLFKVLKELKNIQPRSEEHTSELQSRVDLVCRLLLEKKFLRGVIKKMFRKFFCFARRSRAEAGENVGRDCRP